VCRALSVVIDFEARDAMRLHRWLGHRENIERAIVSNWQGASAANDGSFKLSLRLRVHSQQGKVRAHKHCLEYKDDIHLTQLYITLVRQHYHWLPTGVQHKDCIQTNIGRRTGKSVEPRAVLYKSWMCHHVSYIPKSHYADSSS